MRMNDTKGIQIIFHKPKLCLYLFYLFIVGLILFSPILAPSLYFLHVDFSVGVNMGCRVVSSLALNVSMIAVIPLPGSVFYFALLL